MALFEDEMPVAVDMTLPAHESIDQVRFHLVAFLPSSTADPLARLIAYSVSANPLKLYERSYLPKNLIPRKSKLRNPFDQKKLLNSVRLPISPSSSTRYEIPTTEIFTSSRTTI